MCDRGDIGPGGFGAGARRLRVLAEEDVPVFFVRVVLDDRAGDGHVRDGRGVRDAASNVGSAVRGPRVQEPSRRAELQEPDESRRDPVLVLRLGPVQRRRARTGERDAPGRVVAVAGEHAVGVGCNRGLPAPALLGTLSPSARRFTPYPNRYPAPAPAPTPAGPIDLAAHLATQHPTQRPLR